MPNTTEIKLTDDECRQWLTEYVEVAETVRFKGVCEDFVVICSIENAPQCIALRMATQGFIPFPVPTALYKGTSQREAVKAAYQTWEDNMIANFGENF